jgi:hypothetical protein
MTEREYEDLRGEYFEPVDEVEFRFNLDVTRRRFVQVLGAGLLIVVAQPMRNRRNHTMHHDQSD